MNRLMKITSVKTTQYSYNIYYGKDFTTLLEQDILKNFYDKVFIITQKSLHQLYKKHAFFNLGYNVVIIGKNEEAKDINTIDNVAHELLEKGCTRNSLIIGFGGGVVTDVAGFIASIFMRGIDHVFIPTTLLGMVDGSIGGKTGINSSKGKNILGTFKHPKAIYISLDFLKTLSKKQIINGFAEILKYGLICDKILYENVKNNFDNLILLKDINLMEQIIISCCEHKKTIVEQDTYDKGQRLILNFGHTIGHAMEAYYNYKKIEHGEAVYYGMIAASYISWRLKYLEENHFIEINKLISNIPKIDIKDINIDSIMELIASDKKFSGNKKKFIVLKNIGGAVIEENISPALIRESLTFLINK